MKETTSRGNNCDKLNELGGKFMQINQSCCGYLDFASLVSCMDGDMGRCLFL